MFLIASIAVLLLTFSTESAYASHFGHTRVLTNGLPDDVATYLGRANECVSLSSEQPASEERRIEIKLKLRSLQCARLPAREQKLRIKYRHNPHAIRSMDALHGG